MRRFLRCSLQVRLEKPILYTSGRNCTHDLSKIESELESRGCKNSLESRFSTFLKERRCVHCCLDNQIKKQPSECEWETFHRTFLAFHKFCEKLQNQDAGLMTIGISHSVRQQTNELLSTKGKRDVHQEQHLYVSGGSKQKQE